MYWIIAFVVTSLVTLINLVIVRSPSLSITAEISLQWITGLFYGLFTFVAGLQHVFNSKKMAAYIGWPTSGFQLELGWTEIGLGLSGVIAGLLHGSALFAVALVGTALYLGAAVVHYRDIRHTANHSAGNAGPVFYIDIVMPLVTLVSIVAFAFLK